MAGQGHNRESLKESLGLPLFLSLVPAGFPSPAENYAEDILNLHDFVVRHPASTFFVKTEGNSMSEAGILPGDLLAVDRSLEARHGHIVLAVLEGEFTVKRLWLRNGRMRLVAENADYATIEITEGVECSIWGVVTHVLRVLVQ